MSCSPFPAALMDFYDCIVRLLNDKRPVHKHRPSLYCAIAPLKPQLRCAFSHRRAINVIFGLPTGSVRL